MQVYIKLKKQGASELYKLESECVCDICYHCFQRSSKAFSLETEAEHRRKFLKRDLSICGSCARKRNRAKKRQLTIQERST